MSTSKRVGPAARKNRGDTREKPRHESAPQTRVRVDLARHGWYDDAVRAADYIVREARVKGQPRPELQIRKRADGFHVYRRDLIK